MIYDSLFLLAKSFQSTLTARVTKDMADSIKVVDYFEYTFVD